MSEILPTKAISHIWIEDMCIIQPSEVFSTGWYLEADMYFAYPACQPDCINSSEGELCERIIYW